MYILQNNGIVETLIGSQDNVHESIKDKVIFIEGEIPQFDSVTGKNLIVKYDTINNSVYADYVDRPLTDEELKNQEIENLKAQNAQMLLVLVEGGLM